MRVSAATTRVEVAAIPARKTTADLFAQFALSPDFHRLISRVTLESGKWLFPALSVRSLAHFTIFLLIRMTSFAIMFDRYPMTGIVSLRKPPPRDAGRSRRFGNLVFFCLGPI